MKKFKNILFLSGGVSHRFWPLENKNYIKFLGKTLLEYQISKLSNYGENIYVVLNESSVKSVHSINSVQVITQSLSNPGQAGAIISTEGKLQGETLVININDIFNESALDKFDKNQDLQFLAKKVTDYFPGGYVKLGINGQVTEIVEKPVPEKAPSNIVKLVADYYKDINEIIALLKNLDGDPDNKYERGINQFIKNKKAIASIYNDYWYTIKYPWHLLTLMQFFLEKLTDNQIHKEVKVPSSSVINPPVYIEKGVKIGEFAKIAGPSYIGENTIIADHTLIRASHIGRDSLIGAYSEVARSYIEDHVMLHRNYVGDSVLSSNVLMGSGATTANFRFDQKNINSNIKGEKTDTHLNKLGAIIGKNSKIGVNTTIFPGVKIGKWSFIAPSEIVRQDIKDYAFVQKGSIAKNLQISEN